MISEHVLLKCMIKSKDKDILADIMGGAEYHLRPHLNRGFGLDFEHLTIEEAQRMYELLVPPLMIKYEDIFLRKISLKNLPKGLIEKMTKEKVISIKKAKGYK